MASKVACPSQNQNFVSPGGRTKQEEQEEREGREEGSCLFPRGRHWTEATRMLARCSGGWRERESGNRATDGGIGGASERAADGEEEEFSSI